MRRLILRWYFSFFGCAPLLAFAGAERVEFEGGVFHLHRLSRAESAHLELIWLGDDGRPLGGFEGLMKQTKAAGKKVAFAMNAGIYAQGPKPLGLTVCNGRELVPVNLQNGEGNFFLKPNGVFCIDGTGHARVMESAEFAAAKLRPRLATQSGPLLLRRGAVHRAFREDSPNRRLRNAVGVREPDGQIIFAMSDREDRVKGRVTFHHLARLFLHLGCKDALYLDGDISDMLVEPDDGAKLTPNTFAAMFVIRG